MNTFVYREQILYYIHFFEGLKGTTKTSEFDEFGLLKKIDIHQCGQSILSNTYEFKTKNSDPKYISKQIKSEKIRFGTNITNRSYESDALGNITQINDSIFGNHNYVYDYRGFLIEADGETYAYDGNDNIVRKGNKALTYDPIIKDRLMSFNGESIEYDTSNPLNPKTYNGKTYEFEGRRLTKFIYGGEHYKFDYNDQGLRIRKEDYRSIGTDYIYDGDKLITEISSNHRLDFLYDENGSLYGFIKDMSEKFLYIRDSLQNILGICDIFGNLVVKYKYNPWGQILEVSGSNVSLGNLNPFKYKGYYYDNETGMYYCKSRYYVPDWGRWLNADNHNNLVFDKASLINLFTYCSNNPVNFYDLNGCFSWGDLWNGIKNFFTDTIGCFVKTVKNIVTEAADYLFVGYEEGYKADSIVGDDEKPISFYMTGPSEWWKIWEIRFGVKVNIGDYHGSLGLGVFGFEASVGYKNSSVDLTAGLDKIGIGSSYECNGIEHYNQFYINTIPTALAVAGIIAVGVYAPQLIPLAGSLATVIVSSL